MDDAQCKYATTEKELLAVVFAFEKFRSYLVGSKVIVHTDHAALRHIFGRFDEKVRLEEVKALRDENLPWYADIVNFMVAGEVPNDFDAYKRKKLFKDVRHYYWDKPYLYKRGPDSIYRRCIAGEDMQGVLEQCHGSAYGGHFATFKQRLRSCKLEYGGLLCSRM
ncbi:unnamed protein product [Microthlaspi erraticum]|uniref:Reverse transcriptase RNase H-like domain-containing protein n=1 Tax=Microthlaspi erraticum TaxID=1685480 RepID=A0A6D2HT96_9BRAS|nr:unnamed protein product [Microthlaspi erraticum]